MVRLKQHDGISGARLLLRVVTVVLVVLAVYTRTTSNQSSINTSGMWPARPLAALNGTITVPAVQRALEAGAAGAAAQPQDVSSSSSSSISSTEASTTVSKLGTYTVMEDGKEITKDLLDEPIPKDCHAEPHADYSGSSAAWVVKKQSAAECCRACKEFPTTADGKKCNVWVFCPDPSGVCFTMDGWTHQSGECWLKIQGDWDNNLDLSQSNLKVNRRGPFPESIRKKFPAAPEKVAWMSGVIQASFNQE